MVIPRKLFHIYLYNKHHRPWIFSFKKLATYDEITHYLSATYYDEAFGKFADKYEVRFYVSKCGYKHLLVPIYGVWNNPDDICFEELPEDYVLKTTHGSGEQFYVIKHNYDAIDERKVIEKLKHAMTINFATFAAQYHYAGISPRIIAEKLLVDSGNEMLDDYKVVCSYGKAKAILVCSKRNEGRDYYSTDWKYLEFVKEEYRSKNKAAKPTHLDDMIKAAEVLSRPFPLARVDFYIVEGKLYFGEITLTPSAGDTQYLNRYGQEKIAEMIGVNNLVHI